MGALLGKFRRKAKTTEEILEKLEERINEIEKYSYNTQERKKRFVGNFLAVSIGIYVIAFIIFYFVYFPPTWKERLLYSWPLLLFPIVIILIRRALTWYFQRKLNKNGDQLMQLRGEKKKILEQVMDKETYNVAVNLLSRFASRSSMPSARSALGGINTPRPAPITPLTARQQITAIANNNLTQLTPRQIVQTANVPIIPIINTSRSIQPLMNTQRSLFSPTSTRSTVGNEQMEMIMTARNEISSSPRVQDSISSSSSTSIVTNQALRRPTPFPIINNRDRTVFERIVDVLVGDGPQDRFAMICKQCFAHNGMAVQEDFEFATFRCAYCNALNPSRKQRPVAPRLSVMPAHNRTPNRDVNSSDNTSSEDESDKESPVPRIHLTEPTPPSNPKTDLETSNTSNDVDLPNLDADYEDLMRELEDDLDVMPNSALLKDKNDVEPQHFNQSAKAVNVDNDDNQIIDDARKATTTEAAALPQPFDDLMKKES